MSLNVLDISNHQQGIRLDRLPTLDGLICKASQGTKYPDAYMADFLDQARDLGIERRGVYWWVETHEPVADQLDVLLRHIDSQLELDPSLVLFVDWEPRNPERVDVCAEAVTLLKAATGRQPHVYMNHSTADRYAWQPVRDLGCHLWQAQYAHNRPVDGFRSSPWHQTPSGWEGRVLGVQYTDKGRLDGWAHDLDLNLFWTWPEEKPVTTIPAIRENDPKVKIQMKGGSGWGCACMQITLPLVEAEMLRRGLIKRNIDYYQFGYNKGGVAASAGTHDGAGVVDTAQGITRDQRLVWAEFGWMMAPRTREWGWTGGAHGHGVLHGCVHRSPSAAAQVRSMMAGRDGLVSNRYVDWVKPSRTWQDAVRALPTQPKETAKVAQLDPDFLSAWPVIDAIDARDPDDVTLYGISDADLRDRLIAHGVTFYDRGDVHEEMRYGLADILQGWALPDEPRDINQTAWNLLTYVVAEPPTGITWVELRPIFDAAHSGGAFGVWGEQRTRHSVRAVQAAMNYLSGGDYLPENGIYDAATRQAVANYQVQRRGAQPGSPAADGVPGVMDFIHMAQYVTAKTGRTHRARFLF